MSKFYKQLLEALQEIIAYKEGKTKLEGREVNVPSQKKKTKKCSFFLQTL